MANDSKAQTAKERFAKAKKDAEDAELALPAKDDALPQTDASEAIVAEDTAIDETVSGGDGTDTLGGTETTDDITDVEAPEGATDDQIISAEPAPAPKSDDADTAGGDSPDQDNTDEIDEPSDDGSSFASTALKFLLVFLLGAGIALWAAPRIAPHLPAPIAAWVAPANALTTETEARLIELVAEKTTDANNAAAAATIRADEAAAQVATLSAQLEQALVSLRSDLSAEIGDAAQTRGAAADRVESVAERITAAEAALNGLRTELDSLAGFAAEGAAPGAATLERVAAFGAAVEGLRSEIATLSERASKIEAAAQAADVEALAARVTALEGGEAATANARTQADEIVRQAKIDAALTRIAQSLAAGRAYGEPLAELEQLTGQIAAEGLSETAATGVPTVATLTRTFPGAAQAAYAADLKASAGDGILDNVIASVQGRVGGRPSVETPGNDVGAILSRIEARLSEGALEAVTGEAQGLSEQARAAMALWLGQIDQTIAAQNGLTDLRKALNTK